MATMVEHNVRAGFDCTDTRGSRGGRGGLSWEVI